MTKMFLESEKIPLKSSLSVRPLYLHNIFMLATFLSSNITTWLPPKQFFIFAIYVYAIF